MCCLVKKAEDRSIAVLYMQIEPYITWGTPTLKTTRELITKRGFAKVNKQRMPITDNAMIERELGEHGIVCTEGARELESHKPANIA